VAILESVRDKDFSEAVLCDDPEARSAVREFFLEDDTRPGSPEIMGYRWRLRSHRSLESAPLWRLGGIG